MRKREVYRGWKITERMQKPAPSSESEPRRSHQNAVDCVAGTITEPPPRKEVTRGVLVTTSRQHTGEPKGLWGGENRAWRGAGPHVLVFAGNAEVSYKTLGSCALFLVVLGLTKSTSKFNRPLSVRGHGQTLKRERPGFGERLTVA